MNKKEKVGAVVESLKVYYPKNLIEKHSDVVPRVNEKQITCIEEN